MHLWPHPGLTSRVGGLCWRGRTEDGKKMSPLSPSLLSLSCFSSLSLPVWRSWQTLTFSQQYDRNPMSLLGSGLFPAREGTRGEPTTHSHGRKAEEQSIHPQTGFWKHEQVQESESLFQIRSGSNNRALGFCHVGADQLVENERHGFGLVSLIIKNWNSDLC